jgi:hypothetical protein
MTRKRALDLLLYICIALAFGLLCILFAKYDLPFKWLAMVLESGLVFCAVIGEKRGSWRSPSFWIVLLVLFLLRSLISILVVEHVQELRAFFVGVAFLIETVTYNFLIDAVLEEFALPRLTRKSAHDRQSSSEP